MSQINKSERTCLKCGKLFPSEGSSNRICKPCSKPNERVIKQIPVSSFFRPRNSGVI